MPYPMIQCPTFSEFRSKLVDEFGCEYKQLPGALEKGDDSYPVTYFVRTVDGEELRCVVVVFDDESTRVALAVIKNVCEKLKIDAATFGLHLSESDLQDVISPLPQ